MSPAAQAAAPARGPEPRRPRFRRRGNDGRPKSLLDVVSDIAGMYGEAIDWSRERREAGGAR